MADSSGLKRALALGGSAVGVLATLGGLVIAMAAGTFDGSPPAPLAYPSGSFLDGWDVQVNSSDYKTWGDNGLDSMQAQHGADCSAPPATHENHSYAGAVFQCKDHVMTSIKAESYGAIYLTPPTMADFSNGTATIRWDVSTLSTSGRDWWDVWVTPYGDNLALPLEDWLPGFQGPPKNAIHVHEGNGTGCPTVYRNFSGTDADPGCWSPPIDFLGVTPSATVRTTYQLEISTTHIRYSLPAQPSTGGVERVIADANIAALGWNQGIVQFGHHSYNPEKDCSGPCSANTWHWDNITISPSVPFSIQRFGPRATSGGTINVPASGMLRFAAVCQVKIDGQVVNHQPQTRDAAERPSSYFVPITAGQHTISLQGQDWYQGFPCIAQDFAVWNLGTPGPTATPTDTPTVTLGGTVLVEGRPNSTGVTVSVSPGAVSVLTAADGTFLISGLAAGGEYTVTASMPGFLSTQGQVSALEAGSSGMPTATLKGGDLDGDGAVTIVDVSVVAFRFGRTGGSPNADLNGSGIVDIADVSLVAGNFGLAGPTAW